MITRRLLRHFLPIDDSGSMGPSLRRDDDWMCDTRLHSLEFPIQFSNSRTHSPTRIRSRAPRGLFSQLAPPIMRGDGAPRGATGIVVAPASARGRTSGAHRLAALHQRRSIRPPKGRDRPARASLRKAPRCGVSGRGSVQVGSAKRGGVHARGRRNQSASASSGHGLGRLPRPGGLTPPFSSHVPDGASAPAAFRRHFRAAVCTPSLAASGISP
jgi:hypothetical protein